VVARGLASAVGVVAARLFALAGAGVLAAEVGDEAADA
jgi:hypothetical protein